MAYKWEEEKDKARRTVHFVVNGQTVGYYYEDVSDPGVFPIYVWDHALQDFTSDDVCNSEREAKATLKLLVAMKGWG